MKQIKRMQDDYYKRIKGLNVTHYAGEVSYYSHAPLRAAEKAFLAKLPKNAKILDIGCGSGRFSINAARMGFRVTGVDITPQAIEACKQRATDEHLTAKFKVLDISETAPEGTYDYVFCPRFVINAISTDPRRRNAIKHMYKVCRPGGTIFVESFNIWYMGKGFVTALLNTTKSIYRHVKILAAALLRRPYKGLFPGDIVYPANKVATASIGYAHLPTIFEVRSYLKSSKTRSIYEVIGDKKVDILRPFRYSIWTMDENVQK